MRKPNNTVLVTGNLIEFGTSLFAIGVGVYSLMTFGFVLPLIFSFCYSIFVAYVAINSALKLW